MTSAPERTAGVDTATLERELTLQLDGEVDEEFTRTGKIVALKRGEEMPVSPAAAADRNQLP